MGLIDFNFTKNADDVHEGFFSKVYIKGDYAYKVLKEKHQDERRILLEEFNLGLQFSPHIYLGVISVQTKPETRYALKMKKIEGTLLTHKIIRMREESKNFLNSGKMENIIINIINDLTEAYQRHKHIRISDNLSKHYLTTHYNKMLNKISKFNIFKKIKVPISIKTLNTFFKQKLKKFLQRIDFMEAPMNHGDLSTENIFILKDQPTKVVIIDPYPEILNSLSFKHNIPILKAFTFFYDLARLKLSISSFQDFRDPFDLFNKTIDRNSYFSNFMLSKDYIIFWELIVTLRQIIILFFNYNYEKQNKRAFYFSLFNRYCKHLEVLITN